MGNVRFSTLNTQSVLIVSHLYCLAHSKCSKKGDTRSGEEPALLKAQGRHSRENSGCSEHRETLGWGKGSECGKVQHKENCRVLGHLLCDLGTYCVTFLERKEEESAEPAWVLKHPSVPPN